MRTAHWKAHLLPLLLLSLHSVSVCLAVSCLFDEYVKELGPLKIATAAQQPRGQDWDPLRIVASAKDLEGPLKYCEKKDGTIHELSKKDAESECKAIFDTVTPVQKNILLGIVEKAIALHTDRLLVQRATGHLKIPDFSTHQICKHFNVPAEHRIRGVANADMVLYIGSTQRYGDGVDSLSMGVTCAKSAGDRPIAGGLIFGDGNTEINRHTVRLTAHQIAHALGFSYSEMKSRSMIVDQKVREKTSLVAVVKSDKTKKMAQAHYGCTTVNGMELEDGIGNDGKLSHWERRNAKDELMAKPVGERVTSFMGFYTNLTMAFFEDLGYYKANFTMAEHMEYGNNAGCKFLTGKCMDKGSTEWPNMFCKAPGSNEGSHVCTTDRLGLGACAFEDSNVDLPTYFQYFELPKKGGAASSLTDYCPVVELSTHHGCRESNQQINMPGSLFGKNSMCLDGKELKVKANSGAVAVPVSAVCAEISCEGGSVKVKYNGDKTDKWHDCPEGQSITPSSTLTSFTSGKIKCPKYKEVCTVALDGSSLVPKVIIERTTTTSTTAPQDPTTSQKPKGQPTDPSSGGKPKDSSSVPFGIIHSVAFLVFSFAGYLIA